jgi:DNA invertase Pin-like site-specific DNA recombinase
LTTRQAKVALDSSPFQKSRDAPTATPNWFTFTLITLLDELQALGVAFVSLAEGIDATTPAGRLQLQIVGAIAELERGRIVERVRAGLARARAQGQRLGRPQRRIDPEALARVAGLTEREAARRLGIPRSALQRALAPKPVGVTRRQTDQH